jgi:adenine-specific DNA-methyltransferase
MPAMKRFLTEVRQGMTPQTIWFYGDVGHTQEAKKELLRFVPYENTDNVLDTVKPTRLLRRLVQLCTRPNEGDMVLDFFGGSFSLGHAVLDQNREDGGDRRFCCVQIPEPLPAPESTLKVMTDVGKVRLRNVIKNLRDESGDLTRKTPEDLGFRVFRLDSSNIRTWDPDPQNLAQSLSDANHLKPDRSEDDVLNELLLKLGLDLCAPVEKRSIAGKAVQSIGGGVLLVCLEREIGRQEADPLALGIVAWHRTLAQVWESQLVFRDAAFADDVAKTNLIAILAQHGLANVRSL